MKFTAKANEAKDIIGVSVTTDVMVTVATNNNTKSDTAQSRVTCLGR